MRIEVAPAPALLAGLILCGAACGGGSNAVSYTLLDDMEGSATTIPWVPPTGETAGGWSTSTYCTQADRIAPPPQTIDLHGWSYHLLPEAHETFPGVTSLHAARLRTTAPLSTETWGASIELPFLDSPPVDGGAKLPAPPVPGEPCTPLGLLDFVGHTVDLSAYSGITFWAMADRTGVKTVSVQLSDRNTDPRGGFCNAANPSSDEGCYNNFGTNIALTDSFKRYTIDFSILRQSPYWGVRPNPSVLDLQHVYQLSFGIYLPVCTTDGRTMCAGVTPPAETFDFRIDDIYLVSAAP